MPFPVVGLVVTAFSQLGRAAAARLEGQSRPPTAQESAQGQLTRFNRLREEGIIPSQFFEPISSVGGGEAAESRALVKQEQDAQIAFEEEIQRLALLASRPPAQLTREPVPVAPPSPPPSPRVVPATPPQPTREPVPVVVTDPPEGISMPFSFSDFGQIVSDIAGIASTVRGPTTITTQAAPVTASLMPQIIGGTVGGAIGSGAMSFFGGNGNGTALQRIQAGAGRRVSRRQVVTAARVCGLDQAASTFNADVRDICEVVSKGMPRRGRGISARDLTRTRSTLRKINTMRKSMKQLCSTR